MTGDIQPLKHDMTTDELLAAWKRRLPNTEPTDNQLSCFAIGIEVGRATDAQDTHLIAAAVRAGERERTRTIKIGKSEVAKGQHNLYHCLAVELMEAAIAYGAACAAEERELAAMIVQANAEVCTGGLRTVLMSNAAAIRASAKGE